MNNTIIKSILLKEETLKKMNQIIGKSFEYVEHKQSNSGQIISPSSILGYTQLWSFCN